MTNHVLRLRRDSREFEEDETVHLRDVCFKVEDCIFRVPSWHFEESEMFRDLFQLLSEQAIIGGVSKDHPLRFEGISKNDFKQLVRFMMMDPCLPEHKETFSLPEYTSVLMLSTIWEFEKIRDVAIKEMSALHIDVVEKIALARDYNVSQWLSNSLNDYARNVGGPVTKEHVDRLGWDYVLKILQARDRAFYNCNPSNQRYYVPQYLSYPVALRSKFGDEIERVEGWNSQETTGHIHERQFQDEDSFCLVDMYFLVEDCLFKGHRQFFEVSPIFRDMFCLPVVENTVPDGFSKEQPLRLDGIKRADFKQLLRFMNTNSTHETTFSLPEWTSVLKLSTMWEFTNIRLFVISEMSTKLPINLAEKIALARDYFIPQWLLPSLEAYTRQTASVTIEDVNHLGLDYVLKILDVRDEARILLEGINTRQYSDLMLEFEDEIGRSRTTWSLQKSSRTPVVITTCRKTVPAEQVHENPPPPYTQISELTPETLTWRKTLTRIRLFFWEDSKKT